MFCPKCGTENIAGASFCRSCGVDISLVPQALTGRLPAPGEAATERSDAKKRDKEKPPSVAKATENFILGVGFVFVALSVWKFAPGGFAWWFWMLIPAFSLMGSGLAQYIRAKEEEKKNPFYGVPLARRETTPTGVASSPPAPPELAPRPATFGVDDFNRETAEISRAPSSVTEGTTRHLGVAAAERAARRDAEDERNPSRPSAAEYEPK